MSSEKKAQFFVRPQKGKKKPNPQELADQIADGILKQIDADRAAKGLPPLPEKKADVNST